MVIQFFRPSLSVRFSKIKDGHRQIGQLLIPQLAGLLHLCPRTERGVILIKRDIVCAVSVARDTFIFDKAVLNGYVRVFADDAVRRIVVYDARRLGVKRLAL